MLKIQKTIYTYFLLEETEDSTPSRNLFLPKGKSILKELPGMYSSHRIHVIYY